MADTRLIDTIRAGDRVTIVNRFGQTSTGRAVMPSAHGGWVLNMGGRYGTPGIADDSNVVKVSKPRPRPAPRPRREDAGRYVNGYRVFRDGSYREDFGSDR